MSISMFLQTTQALRAFDGLMKLEEFMITLPNWPSSETAQSPGLYMPKINSIPVVFVMDKNHKQPIDPCFTGPYPMTQYMDTTLHM